MELKNNPMSTPEMAIENATRKFRRTDSKYFPHQNKREMERRVRQMQKAAKKEQNAL